MAVPIREFVASQPLSPAEALPRIVPLLADAVGRIYGNIVSFAAAATVGTDDTVVLATGGAGGITVTLPNALIDTDRLIYVVKVDAGAGAVTVVGPGTQTINAATSVSLPTRWDRCCVVSDLANWVRVG